MYGYRAALAVVGLWLAACSSVAQDFDAELAEAVCEQHVRCGVSYDKDSCKRGLLEGLLSRSGLNVQSSKALRDGRMRYDAEAAKACLEKIRTGSCDEHPLSTRLLLEGVGMSADCRFLFGEVADGERCHASGECGPQSACTSETQFSFGTCQPRRTEGMQSPSHSLCEEGLAYFQSTCQQPLGEGQSCWTWGIFGRGPCAQGLFCDPVSQLCQRPASVGEPCELLNPCEWTLTCFDGTCRAPKGKGAACTSQSRGSYITRDDCMQELFCDAEPGASGTCRELLGEGTSCRDSRDCGRGLYCDGTQSPDTQRGTCRRLAQQDEDCSRHPCAQRFYCSGTSRTCQPRRQFGESCAGEPGSCVLDAECKQDSCGGPPPAGRSGVRALSRP